jgi:hypothetical protein
MRLTEIVFRDHSGFINSVPLPLLEYYDTCFGRSFLQPIVDIDKFLTFFALKLPGFIDIDVELGVLYSIELFLSGNGLMN